ncbi:DNA-processing protein DprA [Actibacterium sp. MT2.3-13A]|uniref:DNA-processing protein DprA n=1 Tax=Actibacterium sp. MT2.3-13A TaxID=2828332 RepID=UPI001BAC14C5|nr:DNA-processing protein DprA [Actibacterium sp. MT2.3-13A]
MVAWLRLVRSRRVGAATFFRLIAAHGSAEAALEALPGVARAAGTADYAPCSAETAARELAAGRDAGARPVAYGSADYPAALAEIPDPPPLLWLRGDPALAKRPMVALVGARNASSLGTRMARRLAEGLGTAGFACVSGLARGVDTAAHSASLDSGTVAVLAGGVDVIYPPENAALADRIAARGLLISEQPMGLQPRARHFPRRNRIISGLSRAVVVVEAAARSGSLITAREALDQGREVLAVPGHPFDARASGCNILIRDGAILVRGPEDVIEALGGSPCPLPARPAPARGAAQVRAPAPAIADLQAEILSRLGPSPLAEDQLIRDLAAPAQAVTPALMELELAGRIRRQAGGLLSLVC